MGEMQMHLVVNGRVIPLSAYYDNLEDSKSDYPWSIYDVWVSCGALYASFKTPSSRRYYGTTLERED